MKLDRRHPIPLYYQLVQQIQDQILSGELQPGDQLPSERVLSQQIGVSRMTVRQGIEYLVRDGLLLVKQGVGTFVAEPKLVPDSLALLGIAEELARRGETMTTQVLEQTVATPPQGAATGLQLPPSEKAIKLARLRSGAQGPLLLEMSYIPYSLCPGLESANLETQPLFDLFERRYELYPVRTAQTLEATTANEYEIDLFGMEQGAVVILLVGMTYTADDRPIEYFKSIYRGDRFKFQFESYRGTRTETALDAPSAGSLVISQ
jgi:GntR family transcriptional regulator